MFEGPLDLLLHLIDKNKVNIYDIPISMITEQYMEYVDALKDEDLDVVSEFLVMAATLLDIKAKMLLPREVNEEGEEEDPRKELVEKLLEYKLYKAMAMELKDRQLDANRLYYRKENIPKEVKEYTPPINLDEVVKDLDLTKLNAIFNDVLRRKEDKIDPVRSKFGKIEKEEVSMSEKLVDIKAYMKNYSEFSFRELLDANSSKVAVIVTFLVILELIKTGFVTVTQASAQDDIFIKVINDPDLIEDIEED
nr:segregation/condensation protein A [Lachnospira multipara]